jgi:mannosyltransferase OCH1-like enzyme
MIKILHFIWVDKFNFNKKTCRLPLKYKNNLDSWKENHKDWNIMLWDGEMIDNLFHEIDNLELLNMYKKYKTFICKIDFAKLVILYYFGGLYVDLDTPCQKNIEPIINTNEILLVKEPSENCKNYKGLEHLKMNEFVISNALIYSEKSQSFLIFIISLYKNHMGNEDRSILLTTGPPLFNMAYIEWYKINKQYISLANEDGLTKYDKDGYCYTTFDNNWTYNKLWTSKLFQEYYFYPRMAINNYFGKENNEKREVEHILGSVAFNTNLDYFFSIPALMDLEPIYKTEKEGVFINKLFFRRNVEIPKIIHRVWIGSKPKPSLVMNTWLEINPGLQYEFWDEERIEREFPGLMNEPIIKNCDEISGKVDVIRIYILRKYGGIYVDADTIALKPIPDEIFNHKMFLAFESEMERGSLVNNCVIGCIKGYYVLDMIINEYNKYHQSIHGKIESVVYYSPGFFTNFLKRNPQLDVFIFPSYYFRRYGHDGMRENTFLANESIMDHVGRYDGRILAEVHGILNKKEDLGFYLNTKEITGEGVIVGYDRGLFARKLLEIWKGKKLYLVEGEPWGNISKEIYKKREEIANYILLEDSRRYEIINKKSQEALDQFENETLDLIILDNHITENSHYNELKNWWPKLKSKGLIFGLNYNNNNISYRNQNVGVREALNKLVDENKLVYRIINKNPISEYMIIKD